MNSKRIKSLIIDDDSFIHNLLQDKLQQHVPEVEILGTATSGVEGLLAIKTYNPDLIFLDVEMSDMTGFEMLQRIENIRFQIIFITSYRHYAIKAIRFNALDYLVKPFDLGELKNAIKRCMLKLQNKTGPDHLRQALINLKTENVAEQKLVLHTQEGTINIDLKHILRIEGERNYSCIYLSNNKKRIATKTLKDLEEILSDKGFFRCHKSHLVNAIHIASHSTSYTAILSDNTVVPIARRKKEEFKIWYNDMCLVKNNLT